MPIRQLDGRNIRRQPAVGKRGDGDAAHGGGGVGEGEELLQPHRQHLRAESQLWGLYAGGVEEVLGAGVRSGVVCDGEDELDHMFL